VLARLAAMVPHTARVDTGVGTVASLNYSAAIVGDSGVGKSSDFSVARNLLMTRDDIDFADELPLGSGEGIAEAFMGEVEEMPEPAFDESGKPKKQKPKLVRKQVRHNVFLVADEGAAMTELMVGRKGSTLGSTLRTAWSGGTLGNANASKDRYRVIPEGSYSLGMVVGFQRATAAPLLADAVAGTPQRFAWVSALDPTIPRQPPTPVGHRLIWDWSIFGSRFTVARAIREWVWQYRHEKKAEGKPTEALDSHKSLMLVKVAALLAVLDKRVDITDEDWALSWIVWDTSTAVRAELVEHIQGIDRARRNAADELHARRAVLAQERLAEAEGDDLHRVARRVAVYVHADGELTRGKINERLPNRDRRLLDRALEYAESVDWVIRDGKLVQPGTSKPATDA
jgi:hypothetical protein